MTGTASLDARPDTASDFREELLQHFAKQGPRVPVPVFASSLLVGTLAWPTAPRTLVVGWVAAVAAVLLLRAVSLARLGRPGHPWPVPRRLALVAAISALGGLVHGSSVAFWPYLDALDRAVQSVFVLGLCAGAVATTFGSRPVFTAYLLPMLAPLAYTWAQALAGPQGAWRSGAAAVLLTLFTCYGGLLWVLARDTYRLHTESFENRRRLASALEQAEAANRAKTRFLASASHDLRQPMHTLTLFGAALAMRPLDPQSRDIAAHMNVALQSLGSQLDALLDMSKLDAGVVPVRPSAFSPVHFLRRLGSDFAPAAAHKGLAFVVAVDESAENCLTDSTLLERVVRNLVDNAIKYTARGEVTLALERLPASFRITVRDTGGGIPPAEQERVYEEFYQLGNQERDRLQGLGLGLSIVRRLSDLLQLSLTMRSAVGKGTEFQFQVPVASSAAGPRPLPLAPTGPRLTGLSVLVIDDEEGVRQGMRTLLEGLGCRASLATGTAQALRIAETERPDIVLADFRLRGNDDGVSAVQQLRARHPGIAALLISGDTAPSRLLEADRAGLRLLHKPVPAGVLVEAIREEIVRVAQGDADGATGDQQRKAEPSAG